MEFPYQKVVIKTIVSKLNNYTMGFVNKDNFVAHDFLKSYISQ